MRRARLDSQEETKDFFSVSISDLMAGLLAIFILTLCYYILNFNQAAAQLTQNDIKRTEMIRTIYQELDANGIKVEIDEEHGILRISEGVLFDVGFADIKPQGVQVISMLGEVLIKTLQSDEYMGAVETIFIEGHTDNVPINNGVFPSNWELSTKRAINTWLLMQRANPDLANLKNKNEQPIFSCSGYADSRPVADNGTEAGKSENRRIDIRFTMTPPTKEDANIVKFVRKEMVKSK